LDATDPASQGHVRLILSEEHPSFKFCLETLLDVIGSLCLKPRKYPVFLGWHILETGCVLALEHGGNGIKLPDGALDADYYVADGAIGGVFLTAVVVPCIYEH
jgi:hypothetical protein